MAVEEGGEKGRELELASVWSKGNENRQISFRKERLTGREERKEE